MDHVEDKHYKFRIQDITGEADTVIFTDPQDTVLFPVGSKCDQCLFL